MKIITKNFTLVRPQKEDSFLVSMFADLETMTFIKEEGFSLEDAVNPVRKINTWWEEQGIAPFKIIENQTGEPVGLNGFKKNKNIFPNKTVFDFGFMILKKHRRKGIIKETSQELFKVAQEKGIKELFATTHPDNTASHKTLESLDFKYEFNIKQEPNFFEVQVWKKDL